MTVQVCSAELHEKYISPPQKVLDIASQLEYEDFPKAKDIITIARIESGFNPKARNGVSRGIMQVNHGPWDMEKSIRKGTEMLRYLYIQLGSEKAAIMSYNIGIGNYLSKRKLRVGKIYLNRFNHHRKLYENTIELKHSSSNTFNLSAGGTISPESEASSRGVVQLQDQATSQGVSD